MAHLVLPAILAERAGNERRHHVSGETVGELLDDLARRHPDLVSLIRPGDRLSRFMNLYVNDRDLRGLDGLATPVTQTDTVTVLPAVAGG